MWPFWCRKEYIDAGEPSDVRPWDQVGDPFGDVIDILTSANLNNSIVYPYMYVT